ncbi:MAG: hypothetical protein ACJARD_000804 [Alphaproteobacteria bacterium]|jgi:hypothetical protein
MRTTLQSTISNGARTLFTKAPQKKPPIKVQNEVPVTIQVAQQRFQDHKYGRQKKSPTINFQDAAKKLGLIICNPKYPKFYRGEAVSSFVENGILNKYNILELTKDTSITSDKEVAYIFLNYQFASYLNKIQEETNLPINDISNSLNQTLITLTIPPYFPIIKIPNDIPPPTHQIQLSESEYIIPKGSLIQLRHAERKEYEIDHISITVLSPKEAQAYRENLPK